MAQDSRWWPAVSTGAVAAPAAHGTKAGAAPAGEPVAFGHQMRQGRRHRLDRALVDVPQRRVEVGCAQHLQALGVARAVRDAEQRHTPLVHRLEQFVGAEDLGLELVAREPGELGVREAVDGQRVALGSCRLTSACRPSRGVPSGATLPRLLPIWKNTAGAPNWCRMAAISDV
jgi:hypothetical protein